MRTTALFCALAAATVLTGCSTDPATTAAASAGTTPAPTSPDAAEPVASEDLVLANGSSAGRLVVTESEHGLQFALDASGLTPGFHGAHVHAVGKCEAGSPDPADPSTTGDFLSAGGHLDAGDAAHPDHAGDLPALLIDANGNGTLRAVTDRITAAQLRGPQGASFVVHAGPDNYANIPTRYASAGADAETKKAGDAAGGRVACAVITAAPGSATS